MIFWIISIRFTALNRNKIKLGFGYEDANAAKEIQNIKMPVLIINSEADTLTPAFMGQDIYDSMHEKGNKILWTVSDSKHTETWVDHNQEYREKVQELLDRVK